MPGMKNTPQERYLSPNQVADLLKVSPITVRHWALIGKLKFVTTPGGHRRFLQADVDQFARDHGVSLPRGEPEKLRVLIVDDNRDLAGYLAVLLAGQEGVDAVSVAHDGFEAGEKIHLFKPSVVLLDLMMPGLDGFETCKRIKQSEVTRRVRVIAMTGYPSEENVQRILAAGAGLCLAKPVRAPELLQALGIEPNERPAMQG
jgi:excisionase family DNA binding protein